MFCRRLRSLNRGSLLCHTCWVCLHFAFGLTEGLPLLQAKGIENLSYTWILCETTFIEKDISITYHIVHIHLNIYLINMYIIHSTDYNFIRCQERFVTITGSKKYVFFLKSIPLGLNKEYTQYNRQQYHNVYIWAGWGQIVIVIKP